jgi:hypothetical protein
MWIGDGLRALDTVLGRAGRKGHLGHAAGNEKMSAAPQILRVLDIALPSFARQGPI